MKNFIINVLSKRDNFRYISLAHNEVKNVQKAVLDSLNLSNVNELRDRFEGVAFNEKFSLKVLGILALENFLKIELIDIPSIDPKTFEPSILIGDQKVNIIMSDYGELPIIDKINDTPAIVTIRKGDREVWICGFADVATLNKYQNDSLIKGTMIKNIFSKTVFVGFDNLKQFESVSDLKNIL